jgi:general secretion pathway protein E
VNAAVDELARGTAVAVAPDAGADVPAAAAELAVAHAAVDDGAIARAIQAAEQSNRSVYEVLAEMSGLAGERYGRALAEAFDYRFISSIELTQLEPDFSILPPAEAARRRCIVVHEKERLIAVFADPFDETLRGWLELKVTAPLEWALTAREDLANLVARCAEALRAIDTVLPETEQSSKGEERVDNLSYLRISEDTSPVVRLVHSTVYDALRAGASDIHLESSASGLTVRYRLDGVLASIATVLGVELAEQIISRIKVMSELDIAERRVPQDGRF